MTRDRLVRLVTESGQDAGLRVEEAVVFRGNFAGFAEHVGQSRLVRLLRRGVGVPADRVERRAAPRRQHLAHPRYEGAGAADAEDHIGAVERFQRGGDGPADLSVIARLVRHVAGGVRLVFDLPQPDSALVPLPGGAHEFGVAVELREAAAPAPRQFAHLFIGPLPLPVGERGALQADVHLPPGGQFPVELFIPVPLGGRGVGIEPVPAVEILQPRRADHIAPAQVFMRITQRQRIRPEAECVHIAVVQAEQPRPGLFAARFGVEEVAAEPVTVVGPGGFQRQVVEVGGEREGELHRLNDFLPRRKSELLFPAPVELAEFAFDRIFQRDGPFGISRVGELERRAVALRRIG